MHHEFKIHHRKPRRALPVRLPRNFSLRLPRRIRRRHDLRIALHLDSKSPVRRRRIRIPVVTIGAAQPVALRILHSHHVDVSPVETRRARVPRPRVVGLSAGRTSGQDGAGPFAARLLGDGGVVRVGGVHVGVVVDGVQSDEFPGGVEGGIVRGESEGEEGLGCLAVVACQGSRLFGVEDFVVVVDIGQGQGQGQGQRQRVG
mmetsp:Transcript_5074/g.9306  ORF Transcript_5074/g.9306 Transcript_5074/m.9306 type:complete len:202 (-) Transcript_5074:158-763(-)